MHHYSQVEGARPEPAALLLISSSRATMPDPARWLPSELLNNVLSQGEVVDLVGASQISRVWRSVAVSHIRFCLPVLIRINITGSLCQIESTAKIGSLNEANQQKLPLSLSLKVINPSDDGSSDALCDPKHEIWGRLHAFISEALLLLKRLVFDVNCAALCAYFVDALCTWPAPLLEEVALRGAEARSSTHLLPLPLNLFSQSAPRLRYLATDGAITFPDATAIPVLQSVTHLAVFGPAGNLALDALTPQLKMLEVRVLPWSRPKPVIHAPSTLRDLWIGDEEHAIDEATVSIGFSGCNIVQLRTLRIEFTHIKDWGRHKFSPGPYLAGLPDLFDMAVRRLPPVRSTQFQAAHEYKSSDPSLRWSSFEIRLTNDDGSIERVFTTSQAGDISAFAFDNAIQRVRRLEIRYLEITQILGLTLAFPMLEELMISLSVDWENDLPDWYRVRASCRPYEASQYDIVRCPVLRRLRINCSIVDTSTSEDMKSCNWRTFAMFLAGELGFQLQEQDVRPHLVVGGLASKEYEGEFESHAFASVSYV